MTATRKQSKKSAVNPTATPDSRKRARSPEPQPSSNPAPLSASLSELSKLTVPELLATCAARKITVSDSAFRDHLLCLLALDKESKEEEKRGPSTGNINNPPPTVRVNNPAVGASNLAALVNRSAALIDNSPQTSIPEKNFAAAVITASNNLTTESEAHAMAVAIASGDLHSALYLANVTGQRSYRKALNIAARQMGIRTHPKQTAMKRCPNPTVIQSFHNPAIPKQTAMKRCPNPTVIKSFHNPDPKINANQAGPSRRSTRANLKKAKK